MYSNKEFVHQVGKKRLSLYEDARSTKRKNLYVLLSSTNQSTHTDCLSVTACYFNRLIHLQR